MAVAGVDSPRLQPSTRGARRPWRQLAVATVGAAVLVSAVRLYEAQRELRAGAELVQQVASGWQDRNGELRLGQAAQSMTELRQACVDLQRGHAAAEPFVSLARPLALIPATRGWGRLEPFLQTVDALCGVRADAQALLEPLGGTDSPADLGPALLSSLQAREPLLRRLASHSALAANRLAGLRPADFGGPLAPVGTLAAKLQTTQRPLALTRDHAAQAPRLADSLLGGTAPRTYLLIGQDNDEPRATGGFVGVMGPLQVSGGRVVQTDFRSSYDWDEDPSLPLKEPPQPLRRYMNLGGWFLRDANWWPDFSTSAAQFEALWRRSQGSSLDGVIAVDLYTLDDLLRAVDGVDVPELGGHVTAGTAEAAIEQRRATREALASYQDYQRTKTQLLGALYRALLAKLLHPAPDQLPRIAAALLHDLETKHLLLALDDPALAVVAREQGWDGHITATAASSSVAIFDTEVSYGKLGPYVTKKATYEVTSGGQVTLSLTYRNAFKPAPGAPWDPFISGLHWDWQKGEFVREQGAWLDYIRVAVPSGSQLEAAVGWDDQPARLDDLPGFMTFAAPVLVRPAEARIVRLQYQLPPGLDDHRLTVIAQPGAKAYSLVVRLPEAEPQAVLVDGRDVRLGKTPA